MHPDLLLQGRTTTLRQNNPAHCWVGKVDKALDFLQTRVKIRNHKVLEVLENYILKHKAETINQGKHQKAGNPIGSGIGEADRGLPLKGTGKIIVLHVNEGFGNPHITKI